MRYQRRNLINRTEGEESLGPWVADLREALVDAAAKLQKELDEDPERRVWYGSGTQAAMLYDIFVALLTTRLYGRPGVRIEKRGRMTLLRLGPRVRLRFKKFDKQLRSKNVKTDQQSAIYFQLEIPGLSKLTDLTFGYRLDATGRELLGAWITCPISWSRNKWSIRVLDGMADATPILPMGPSSDLPLPEIKPVGDDEQQATSG